jgi:hypothetical protein
MKRYLLTLVSVTLFSLMALSQSKSEKQVAEVTEKLRRAMIDADKNQLQDLTSAQLSYGHSGGHVENQNEFVEKIVSGKSDFVTIDLADQTINISGKTAIVRHKLNATTNDSGKAGEVHLLVLLIWQKKHGHWKLLARQAVKAV